MYHILTIDAFQNLDDLLGRPNKLTIFPRLLMSRLKLNDIVTEQESFV